MLRTSRASALLVILGLLFVWSSCSRSVPVSNNETVKKKDIVDLPNNVEAEEADLVYETFTEEVMVLALTADNILYREQHHVPANNKASKSEAVIAKGELPKLLTSFFADKAPEKRVVYLKADVNTAHDNVLQIFDSVRHAGIDRVVLIVIDQDIPKGLNAGGFEVRMLEPPKNKKVVKPNPLTLVAILTADGRLSLNYNDQGRLSDPQELENSLREIFSAREDEAVFREGTNEIEKTVFLKVSKSNKYAELIELMSIVKRAGADRIVLQIDDDVD